MASFRDAWSIFAWTWKFATPPGPFRDVSSWKCVANRHGALTSLTMCSLMAHARPKPSYVLVPRPSSSMMMSDLGVAALRIAAVSSISAMNVEMPRIWQSPAPTRAKMASRIAIFAEAHGTNDPT